MACTAVILAALTLAPLPLVSTSSFLARNTELDNDRVTPVEKVISLLNNLKKQIETEGTTEAAEYDKYACFCKEQADNKQYAIEKSTEKIDKLDASIKKVEADIADLNTAISDLGTKIEGLEKDITKETEARNEEHKKYVKDAKDLEDAVDACEKAIAALKESKAKMKEKGAKVDLPQVHTAVNSAIDLLARVQPSEKQLSAITALTQMMTSKPGPVKIKYQSNDIIATLQALRKDFVANLKDLDMTEIENKGISDKKKLGMINDKKFAEKDKMEKETLVEEKTEKLNDEKGQKTAEEKAKQADDDFLTELQDQCEKKAKQWDQRSKTRAAELTALSEATETLESGVKDAYKANKKLAGVEISAKVTKAKALTLIQESSAGRAQVAVQRAVQILDDASSQLKSSTLIAFAAKVVLQKDNFVKVRGLIKDLIQKLKDEALAEADQKKACDGDMDKALASRDDQQLEVEKSATTVSEKTAEVAQLKEDIVTLGQDVADLSKALNEATELRADEKVTNEQTIAEAIEGKAAVEKAKEILTTFYDANAFLQKKAPEDRDGNTVKDLAPETSFSDDYKGKQESSKGIIGLLEVIQSDFERTIESTKTAESDAQTNFEDFEKTTKDDIKAKGDESKTKEKSQKDAEEAITTAKEDRDIAERKHSSSLKELEKLKAMCVEGEETYAERKKKREQEIEALKTALKTLEEWKD